MKEKKLDELLTYLMDTVKAGIEFSKKELPVVVEEMLKFDAWEAGMWFAIPIYLMVGGLITLVLCVLLLYITEKKLKKCDFFIGVGIVGGVVGSIMFGIGLIVMPLEGIPAYFKIKKIENAPKYYLIDKLIHIRK